MCCAASAILWGWSHAQGRRWIVYSSGSPGTQWEIRSASGWVKIKREEVLFWPEDGTLKLWGRYSDSNLPFVTVARREGVTRKRLADEPPIRSDLPTRPYHYMFEIGVSYVPVCLVSAAVPLIWLRRRGAWKRQRRAAAGLCPACGYDIRATPDQCPECGAAPSAGI